jgi:hypothetical protein
MTTQNCERCGLALINPRRNQRFHESCAQQNRRESRATSKARRKVRGAESLEKELRCGTSWARAERIMCNYNRDAKEGMD